jgi:hypothetical protein
MLDIILHDQVFWILMAILSALYMCGQLIDFWTKDK